MTSNRIVIAGFTSRVAQLIAEALLLQPGVEIIGICRDPSKVSGTIAQHANVTIVKAESTDKNALLHALRGASVCICSYFGPDSLMLEGQTLLIDLCIASKVPRYMASDFSFDYRGLKIGDFPFKDFQLKVGQYLEEKESQGLIKAVHVLNGGFYEAVLFPFMGLLDAQHNKIRYWGAGNEPWDMTSMEDTAKFAARVASDENATGWLKVRGDSKSAKEIAATLEEIYGMKFTLENLGSIEDLHEKMVTLRESSPENIGLWLGLHYSYFTINGATLLNNSDHERYSGLKVKNLAEFSKQYSLERLVKLFR